MPDTRLEELRECHEIVLKTARRCARDLRHAVDQIPSDNPFKGEMNERYQLYSSAREIPLRLGACVCT
jgi:hypothetical protein